VTPGWLCHQQEGDYDESMDTPEPAGIVPLDATPTSHWDAVARDALRIWQAGVAAVESPVLIESVVRRDGSHLIVAGETFDLTSLRRIVVVGAGKASGGMGQGLERALGDDVVDAKVTGWINVPDDCVIKLRRIHLHGARPAGVNEPTEHGVAGSERILELVSGLGPDDLCLVLLSGGGSALLPLPVPGISLADKLSMTRSLSRNGASIHELNTVRKRLSRIKGGGLACAPTAGRMVALIISDVVGDPLEIIASGPTVIDSSSASDAIAVLTSIQQRSTSPLEIPESIWVELKRQISSTAPLRTQHIECRNVVIGNNQTALLAACDQARMIGYQTICLGNDRQGSARIAGEELAERCLQTRADFTNTRTCLIGGGETVVELANTTRPRQGGRNQELALAALCRMWNEDLRGIAILSAGTDGEDGPTDAAGAVCTASVRETARAAGLDPWDALSINDSYTFFAAADGLLKTGPTRTNVMDLQIAIVDTRE
jgi:hydroxypyruvate reductase